MPSTESSMARCGWCGKQPCVDPRSCAEALDWERETSGAVARPRLLDLFCKEGGAAKGYQRAGFYVLGVDIEPQPNYCGDEFVQMDALAALDRWLGAEFGAEPAHFDAIHASPPCQAYSKAQRLRGNDHPALIAPTRERLLAIGLPYVIENVEDARDELREPITLCGMMFGRPFYRHRLFECSPPITEPLHAQHWLPQAKMGRSAADDELIQAVGNFAGASRVRQEMEMPWATRDGLREAVPPVYTEYIGARLAAIAEGVPC